MGYDLTTLPTDHWSGVIRQQPQTGGQYGGDNLVPWGNGTSYPGGSDTFDETTGRYDSLPYPSQGSQGGPGENPGGDYWQPPIDTGGGGGYFPDPANGSYGPQQPGNGNSGGSNSWLPDWLNPVNGFEDNNGMANGVSAILGASAINQFRNAGQYSQMGKDAAQMADPFGQYRRGYGDRLQSLYDDPSQIENTPGYKFALQQGLGALDRKDAARGLTGSGLQDKDRMDYASGLAQQTWNTEANRLGQFAGSQFDPSNAGKLWMTGATNSINSQNAALGSLLGMFASQMQAKYANKGSGQGGGSTGNGGGSGSGGGGSSGNPFANMRPGSVLPDGRVYYGTNPDGSPHIGEGNQGGWPGEPEGGYQPDPPPEWTGGYDLPGGGDAFPTDWFSQG